MLLAAATICVAASSPADDAPRLRAPVPALPASARSAAGFAPAGWRVEKELRGDLDGDGRADLVAILRGADPACVVRPQGSPQPMDTNPRVVLAAFGGAAGFRRHLANATVIPRIDDPYMDDPLNLDAFAIHGGVLRLGLTYWRSMGGWTTFGATLSFRWDGRRMRLIGFDRESLQRNSGRTETLSVDFLTGRARLVTGSMEDGVVDQTRWRRVRAGQAPALETIGDGLAFEPKLTVDPRAVSSPRSSSPRSAPSRSPG